MCIVCFLGKYAGPKVAEVVRFHRWSFTWLIFIKVIIVVSAVSLLMAKHYEDPKFPAFLTNLLYDSLENYSYHYLILLVSYMKEVYMQILLWGYILHFFFTSITFSRSIEHCIELICYDLKSIVSSRQWKKVEGEADQAVIYFHRLHKLVKDFSEIFAWFMFFQLGGSIALCCIFGYVPLKHWKTTSFGFLLQNIAGCGYMIVMYSRLYPVLGRLYDKTEEFKRSWMSALALALESDQSHLITDESIQNIMLKLKSCYPYGFICGHFFVIRTYTMLTCFSAVSSYIVIMLQFGI
jgi:hypothetical protein